MEVIFRKIDQRVPEILQYMEQDLDSYSAIHIKLSQLQKQNKSLYQAKMAVNIIHEVMSSYQGWLIFFLDYDLVCVFRNIDSPEILKILIEKIRKIFVIDPLAYFSNKITNPDFANIYEFPFNYKYFKNQVEGKLPKQNPEENRYVNDKIANKNISSLNLKDIENRLMDIDINNVIRKQAICGFLNKKQALKPIFYEIHISLPLISRILSFNFEDKTNKFLIKYFEEILQKKLLEHLINDSRVLLGNPFSIAITPNVIFSDLFLEFDKTIKDKIEHSVIVEIEAADLFSDMRNAILALNQVRALSYKVCIKGLNEINIKILNKDIFKVDFGKLEWTENFYDRNGYLLTEVKESINLFNPNRLIINNCNNFDIITLGKQMGINLFQGWECDQMLKNKNIEILEFA